MAETLQTKDSTVQELETIDSPTEKGTIADTDNKDDQGGILRPRSFLVSTRQDVEKDGYTPHSHACFTIFA